MLLSEWPVTGCVPWCICLMCEICERDELEKNESHETRETSSLPIFFVYYHHKRCSDLKGMKSIRAESIEVAMQSIKHVASTLPHYEFRL